MKEKIRAEQRKTFLIALLAAALVGLAVTIIYAIQGIAPFGENSVLRNDAIAQYNPILTELVTRVLNGGSLLFSWQSGFGANFFCSMLYYLINPFNVVAFFFRVENIQLAYGLIILLNFMLIGFNAALYCQKHFHTHSFAVAAFSLAYAFCGFILGNYYNTMWMMAFAMLPLIALGIERLVNGKMGLLYCLSLFTAIFCNFYLGYMLCIFSVLYFFVCLFAQTVTKKGEVREKKETLLPVLLRFGVFSLLAGGLSAVTLLPVQSALSTSFVKNPFSFQGNYFFEIGNFLEMHLSGMLANNMLATQNTVPQVSLCMAALILLTLFWFAKGIALNKKVTFTLLTVFLWCSFEIPAIYYVWHGMSNPAGMPYRFAFIYSFVLLIVAAETFKHLHTVPKWSFFVPVLAGAAMYFYAFQDDIAATGGGFQKILIQGLVFTVLAFGLLLLYRILKKGRKAIPVILTLCICTELIFMNSVYFMWIETVDNMAPYRAQTEAIRTELDAKESGAFYRMEFNYPTNTLIKIALLNQGYGMTPSLYGYNGVTQFSSLANWKFALTQYALGNSGNSGNAFGYSMQTPVYNTLFGLKYVLDNAGSIRADSIYYQEAAQADGLTAYENVNYIGLGTLANTTLTDFDPFNSNPFITQNNLWYQATGIAGVFEEVSPADMQYDGCHSVSYEAVKAEGDAVLASHEHEDGEEHEEHEELSGSVFELMEAMGSSYLYKIDTQGEFSVTCTLIPEKDQDIYFSFNSGAFNRVEITDAQGGTQSFSVLQRSMVNLGYRKGGEKITITFSGKGVGADYTSEAVYDDVIYLAVAALDNGKYQQGLAALRDNGTVNLNMESDTHISGTLSVQKDSVLMLSMVRDEGWNVYIDGVETELTESESHIMMLAVAAGEHTIEMRYVPVGLKEGAFVSAASLAALLLVVLLLRVRKNREPEFDGPQENPDARYVRKPENSGSAGDEVSDVGGNSEVQE